MSLPSSLYVQSPEDARLSACLAEIEGYLDKAQYLLWQCGCDDHDEEFERIREGLGEVWKGR